MDMTRTLPTRDRALDALRGLAIFGMVLANLQGDDRFAFPLLAHAAWDGLTIADIVFPTFLLAVGLALPLSIDGRVPRFSVARIVQRSMLLYLIGFGIGFLMHASTQLSDMRFTGVLPRIGIVYLVAALVTRATTGWRTPVLIAVALMAVHGVLLYVPAPGEAAASMAPGLGLSAWLDRLVLGGTRMYGKTFDPEGPLSTLGAIATALIGVAAQRGARPVRQPNAFILTTAALLAGLAVFAAWGWPVNKALWTPTFVLVNAAIGLGLWGVLRLAWPRIGAWPPMRLTETLGQVALTLFVVHALLTALLVMVRIGGVRLWKLAFDALAQLGLPLDWTSLLFAVIAGSLSILITLALRRRGWVLRV